MPAAPPIRPTPAIRTDLGIDLQVLQHRHSDGILEALCKRRDGPLRLVEEDPLHAEEGDEHRDQVDVRLVAAGKLPQPVVERVEVDPAHRHARRREGEEHPEELLLRIDEIDDHERVTLEALDHCGRSLSRAGLLGCGVTWLRGLSGIRCRVSALEALTALLPASRQRSFVLLAQFEQYPVPGARVQEGYLAAV